MRTSLLLVTVVAFFAIPEFAVGKGKKAKGPVDDPTKVNLPSPLQDDVSKVNLPPPVEAKKEEKKEEKKEAETKKKVVDTPFGGGEKDTVRQMEYEMELEERAELERQRLTEERRAQMEQEREALEREREMFERKKEQDEDRREKELAEKEREAKEKEWQKAQANLAKEEKVYAEQVKKYGENPPPLPETRPSDASLAIIPEPPPTVADARPLAPQPIADELPPKELRAPERKSVVRAAASGPSEDPADLYLPDDMRPAAPPPPAAPVAQVEKAAPPPPVRVADTPAYSPLPEGAKRRLAESSAEAAFADEDPPGWNRAPAPAPEPPRRRARTVAARSDANVTTARASYSQSSRGPARFGLGLDYANNRYASYVLNPSVGGTSSADSHGFHAGFEWMPIVQYGKLGLGIGVGYIAMPKTTVGGAEVAVNLVPLDAYLVYRFSYMEHQILVPYVKIGSTFVAVTSNIVSSGGTSSSSATYLGLDLAAGLQINLRFAGARDAATLDREYGINDVFLVGELLYSKALNTTTANLESRQLRVGLRFEF